MLLRRLRTKRLLRLVNDFKIKGSKPISENLSTLTIGDERTCLEITGNNGARITGDLQVTGDIYGNIKDVVFEDITFDDVIVDSLAIGNLTITGTEIDLSSGNLTIDCAENFILDAEDDVILDIGTGDDLLIKKNGSIFAKFNGNSNGVFTLYSSAGGADSITIQCSILGTYITTNDSDGKEADLDVQADGAIFLRTIDYGGSVGNGEHITLNAGKDVIIDKNYSNTDAVTIKGLYIDIDKTGASTTNNYIYGLHIDTDNTTATNGTNVMYGVKASPTLTHAADAGIALVYGAYLTATAATNGGGTAIGLQVEASGGDVNRGIQVDCLDGGDDIRILSTADNSDYCVIQTIAAGATTISTIDSTVDATGHLTLSPDGNLILGCVPGGKITLQENDASAYTPSAASDATTKAYVDAKYFFSQTMNYYSRFSDFDLEWLILNNESNYKLGGTDTSVDDTQTADINDTNQTIARSLWFIVPFNMTITHISGTWQDVRIDGHPAGAYHMGLWVVASIGTSGSTPTAQTGTKTFTLKYVTPTVSGTEGDDQLYAFYDASPSLTLSAGDAVWAGAYNARNSSSNDTTISMSIWGYAT